MYKPHNVHRHLFPPSAVGRPKAELAAEWLRERRPDLAVEVLVVDLTDPALQPTFEKRSLPTCDVGVCAADNEPAKYHFDALMRPAGKPWTLGEVLSGGIGGWVHRFAPAGRATAASPATCSGPSPSDPPAPAAGLREPRRPGAGDDRPGEQGEHRRDRRPARAGDAGPAGEPGA